MATEPSDDIEDILSARTLHNGTNFCDLERT